MENLEKFTLLPLILFKQSYFKGIVWFQGVGQVIGILQVAWYMRVYEEPFSEQQNLPFYSQEQVGTNGF